jgi:hypothetical protein
LLRSSVNRRPPQTHMHATAQPPTCTHKITKTPI